MSPLTEPTSWVPAVRAAFDVAALATIGTLVVAGWLLPDDTSGRRVRARLGRVAGRWAWLWVATAAARLLLLLVETSGQPLEAVSTSARWWLFGLGLPEGRALLGVATVALAVALRNPDATASWPTRVWAGLSAFCLVPLLATGHAATAAHHYVAAQSLVVHVLAVTVWVGGLLALVVHLRREPGLLPHALPRFSRLAGWAFAAVAGSGLIAAWSRVGLDTGLLSSRYGVLLVAKSTILVVLGIAGGWQRHRLVDQVRRGRLGAFRRLALSELVLMAGALGAAAILAGTPPPAAAALRAVPPHASAYSGLDPTLGAPGPGALLTTWRADVVMVTAVLVVIAGVSVAAGSTWTPRRQARWLGASGLAGWALVGAPGAYAGASVTALVGQFLLLALVAPALLAPVLPAIHARWVPRPLDAALGWVLLAVLSYRGPLLDWVVESAGAHHLLALAWLAAGLVLALSVRSAPALDRSGSRLIVLIVALGLGIMVVVVGDGPGLAGGWYADHTWWWEQPVADQRAAQALLVAALGMLGLVGLLHGRTPVRLGDTDHAGPRLTGLTGLTGHTEDAEPMGAGLSARR
ncbi:MAG: CopD family protein [Nocardioides sp.]